MIYYFNTCEVSEVYYWFRYDPTRETYRYVRNILPAKFIEWNDIHNPIWSKNNSVSS